MRAEDYWDEKMKDPEFRAAVEREEKYMKYWWWYEELRAWIDYFIDWLVDKWREYGS